MPSFLVKQGYIFIGWGILPRWNTSLSTGDKFSSDKFPYFCVNCSIRKVVVDQHLIHAVNFTQKYFPCGANCICTVEKVFNHAHVISYRTNAIILWAFPCVISLFVYRSGDFVRFTDHKDIQERYLFSFFYFICEIHYRTCLESSL